jgi:hypothetical protein
MKKNKTRGRGGRTRTASKNTQKQPVKQVERVRKITKKIADEFWQEVEGNLKPEEFDIPADYAESILDIPYYRKLNQNIYRPPLERPRFDEDDAFICTCSPEKGCGPNCQNRIMFT